MGNQSKQEKIRNWYKQTSCFTDLGAYKEFAENLPEDIRELCLLQRHQLYILLYSMIKISENKNMLIGEI